MSKNQQGIFWASVAVAMVIISAWVIKTQFYHSAFAGTVAVLHLSQPNIKHTANIADSAKAPVPDPASATTTPDTASSTPPKVYRRKTPPKPPVPNYGDVVAQYGNLRIQFDQNCQAHPNQIAIANPVTLMLDNRTPDTQKITVGGKVYNVAGYNYVIFTINEKTVPINVFINCNQQTNVAEIILQK